METNFAHVQIVMDDCVQYPLPIQKSPEDEMHDGPLTDIANFVDQPDVPHPASFLVVPLLLLDLLQPLVSAENSRPARES